MMEEDEKYLKCVELCSGILLLYLFYTVSMIMLVVFSFINIFVGITAMIATIVTGHFVDSVMGQKCLDKCQGDDDVYVV